jgi:hypothetical protein
MIAWLSLVSPLVAWSVGMSTARTPLVGPGVLAGRFMSGAVCPEDTDAIKGPAVRPGPENGGV